MRIKDIAPCYTIVSTLSERTRPMDKIDKVIEKHGGWPAAFRNIKTGIA